MTEVAMMEAAMSFTAPRGDFGTMPREATVVHARLLRLALGVEESRAYWEHVDTSVAINDRPMLAFEERWLGAKSLERVRFLLANFVVRYDAYPEALSVLTRWRSMDAETRRIVCHFHLQLSDPLYRSFTGRFLVERRRKRGARLDRDATLRWVKDEFPERWSEATCVQFASKLLSASSEAGLISPRRDPRTLLFPKVPDVALEYLLHVLRETKFEGTIVENPYLASIGLDGGFFDQRLAKVDSIRLHRMGGLFDLEWAYPSLAAWGKATL